MGFYSSEKWKLTWFEDFKLSEDCGVNYHITISKIITGAWNFQVSSDSLKEEGTNIA